MWHSLLGLSEEALLLELVGARRVLPRCLLTHRIQHTPFYTCTLGSLGPVPAHTREQIPIATPVLHRP